MSIDKCPNCGANLTNMGDIKYCPYCSASIPTTENKHIQVDINTRHEDAAGVAEQKRKTFEINLKLIAKLIVAILVPISAIIIQPPLIGLPVAIMLAIICVKIK